MSARLRAIARETEAMVEADRYRTQGVLVGGAETCAPRAACLAS